MSETTKSPGDAFFEAIRLVVREGIQALNGNKEAGDHLLDAEEASKLLSVSEDWLYRYSRRLPFARKLAPRMLRFSYQGILKWLATRKLS